MLKDLYLYQKKKPLADLSFVVVPVNWSRWKGDGCETFKSLTLQSDLHKMPKMIRNFFFFGYD